MGRYSPWSSPQAGRRQRPQNPWYTRGEPWSVRAKAWVGYRVPQFARNLVSVVPIVSLVAVVGAISWGLTSALIFWLPQSLVPPGLPPEATVAARNAAVDRASRSSV
jgi:hypothetical protein